MTKLTRKLFYQKSEEKSELITQKRLAQDNDDMPTYFAAKKKIVELDENFFDTLPMVNVSFCIGYRSYYRKVVKIGKTCFTHGESMTQTNGYRNVTEIPEITEKMKHEMLSDSYYY